MTGPAESPRHLRIFVVEDHADTLAALRRQLERAGHIVHTAASAEQALSRLPECECDVLLSDIGLPDASGWDLLRSAAPYLHDGVVAIAMSGYGGHADRARSAGAGFHHHLVKPFRRTELFDLLKWV